MIKQRRRWAGGLLGLIFDKTIMLKTKFCLAYFVFVWVLGIFQHVGIVLIFAYLSGTFNTSPVLREFILVWSFNLAYVVWMYLEGLKINMNVSRLNRKYLIYSWLLLPLIFLISAVEALASILGLLDFLSGKKGFEVISKRR